MNREVNGYPTRRVYTMSCCRLKSQHISWSGGLATWPITLPSHLPAPPVPVTTALCSRVSCGLPAYIEGRSREKHHDPFSHYQEIYISTVPVRSTVDKLLDGWIISRSRDRWLYGSNQGWKPPHQPPAVRQERWLSPSVDVTVILTPAVPWTHGHGPTPTWEN